MEKKRLKSLSRPNRKLRSFLLYCFLSSFLFSGCSTKITDLHAIDLSGQNTSTEKPYLKIGFYGVACFSLQYEDNVVLTDPFISNPTMKHVLFGKIRTDTALVNEYLSQETLKHTDLVIVGHAHYDHLLDLPYVAEKMPASAIICGNNTARHILAPAHPKQKVVGINDLAGNNGKPGTWIYSADSSVRIMAFLSDHPPHFMGITLYKGPLESDLNKIPVKTRGYKCGQPLSYLIDFLKSDEAIAYRIFFQSSSSEYPLGFFPETLNKEKKVDVAIFSIATKFEQEKYPYKMIEYCDPDMIFLAHWENFMRDKKAPYKTVQKGKPVAFKKKISGKYPDKEVILPAPGASFNKR